MKRLLSVLMIISMVFGFSAYQCGSTEMTSAKLYIQQEKFDKAEGALKQELKKNPKNDEAFYLLGFVQGEQKQFKNMLDNYSKSLKISNKFADKINQSTHYFWGTNFNKGVANFNRATKTTDPDSIKMFYGRAIEAFDLSILFHPDSAQGYENIVFAFLNSGKVDESIPYLEKLIDITGKEDAYVRLGRIYFDKGEKLNGEGKTDEAKVQYNKAIEVLKKGSEAHPESVEMINVLSFAYLRTDQMDVALESFKTAVAKDPENPEYRYIYGTLLLQGKDYQSAISEFETALQYKPEHDGFMRQLVAADTNWGIEILE